MSLETHPSVCVCVSDDSISSFLFGVGRTIFFAFLYSHLLVFLFFKVDN